MKLGLSRKFPRMALYSRKSILGVGLILSSILIVTLKLKLHIGNKRKLGNAVESIAIQKESQEVDAGREVILGEDPQL